MNIARYKWKILFDTTNKSPIFAAMKNNLLGSYKHIVIIYWILVSAVYAVQTFRLYRSVDEALLITFSVCSVVILVNVACIDSISGGRLWVHGKELPISLKRKEELLDSVVYRNLISR